jgi:uncharacterized hydrophobic protein (TIGR00271 family)
MRQIWVKVERGQGSKIMNMAQKNNGSNLMQFQVQDETGPHDVVIMNIDNEIVSEILKELDSQEDAEITFYPQDVYPLSPPNSKVPDHITHVTTRSPVEIWLNGLQSIGSWEGFLGYTLAASIIVWIGLYTNTIFLLVGAMLVSPYAGPAMNFAMATAAGDRHLMWRNVFRYFISILLTILFCCLLSLFLGQERATNLMVEISQVSSVAVLLPLVVGGVGALHLSQASNNSLVAGTAVGALVAASLAPPAGLIGMSAAIGRWDMAVNGAFVLLLQLLGINLAGALVFRYFGMRSEGTRFQRGKQYMFYLSLGVSVLGIAALMWSQFSTSPDLQRATQLQRAVEQVQQLIQDYPGVNLVETNLRFTRPSIEEQNTMLGVIYVMREPDSSQSAEDIRDNLTHDIQQQILQEFDVIPVISVTVLESP